MQGEFCPSCGTARIGALRYCRSCGFDFDTLTAGARPMEPTSVQPAGQPAPVQPAHVEPATAPAVAWVQHPPGEAGTKRPGRSKTRLVLYGVGGLLVLGVIGSILNPRPEPGTAAASGAPTPSPAPSTAAPATDDPVAGVTPGPTASVATEATPEPTPEPPAFAFEPFTLSGSGSEVAQFTIPEDAPAIATISNRGAGNFAVWTVGADGSQLELLVNEIGNFDGTKLFDAANGEHSVAFKIESDGAWTIDVKPITAARTWDGASQLAGKGADVILVVPPISGFVSALIIHDGDSNFAIWTYSDSGRDLLVNEIGAYRGEHLVSSGTALIAIEADDNWSITPQ
jgi:hypothetical protein